MKTRAIKLISRILTFAFSVTILAQALPITAYAANQKTSTAFNGHSYQVFELPMTWSEAKAYCENEGGHLATVTSSDEQDFITGFIKSASKQNLWIGLSDEAEEGKWKWVTGEKFDFSNWSKGEPNNWSNAENYVGLVSRDTSFNYNVDLGQWNDFTDTGSNEPQDSFGFICEWESTTSLAQNSPTPAYAANQDTSAAFNGHTYQVFEVPMTWSEAKSYCENVGGYLATITSSGEQNFISGLIKSASHQNLWIGLSDDAKEGEWKWVTGEKFNFSNWCVGEPNNWINAENYVGLVSRDTRFNSKADLGQWNDFTNTGSNEPQDSFGFICERENSDNNQITVVLNGDKLTFDQPPIIENGRTLVPLRVIFEAMGAAVAWDNTTQTVTGKTLEKEVSLKIGSDKATINGAPYYIDVAAKTLNGRTLVPLRFVAESLGAYVEWDGTTNTATIYDNADANLIASTKAYTTIIPDYMPAANAVNSQTFKDYINAGLYSSEATSYKALTNNDMYIAYQFEQYAKSNLSVQVAMGLGKTVFNGDTGDYLTLQSPEKNRFKKMLISYMNDNANDNQIEYAASEFFSLGSKILDSVNDTALQNSSECKVAYDTIVANLEYLNNSPKTLDGMTERIALIVKQEELLKSKGVIVNPMNGIDSNAVKFLETKYKTINKINTAVNDASYVIDIATAGIDSYKNIVEIYGLAATYDEYSYLFDAIIQKSTNNDLRAAAYELQTEINSKITTLCNETHKVLGSTLVATGGLVYQVSLSSLSNNLLGRLASSVGFGTIIGTLIANIGFETADMLDSATYAIGYSEIAQILTNKLKEENAAFITNYTKSYTDSAISAQNFFKCYETLRKVRISGEQAYLSMRSFDNALLDTQLKNMTDYAKVYQACTDNILRLRSCIFVL